MKQIIIPECAKQLAYPKFADIPEGEQMRSRGLDNEWYTPASVIAVARETMGGIDLDPASCAEANTVVRADKIYTIEDNGWTKQWRGRVFLNPPFNGTVPGDGGRQVNNKTAFIDKLVDHYRAGDVAQACLVCFIDFSPRWGQGIRTHATAVCFGVGRWDYWKADSQKKRAKKQAGLGSMLAYFGPHVYRFASACEHYGLGFVMVPHATGDENDV